MNYSIHLSDTVAEETRQAILVPLRDYNVGPAKPAHPLWILTFRPEYCSLDPSNSIFQ